MSLNIQNKALMSIVVKVHGHSLSSQPTNDHSDIQVRTSMLYKLTSCYSFRF